jgi:hypothetical protein
LSRTFNYYKWNFTDIEYDFDDAEKLTKQIDNTIPQMLVVLVTHEITRDIDAEFILCLKKHILTVLATNNGLKVDTKEEKESYMRTIKKLLPVVVHHMNLFVELARNKDFKDPFDIPTCSLTAEHSTFRWND